MTPKKLPSWRLCWRPVAFACALASASLSAQALNLGRFSVQSGLGEPLRAEVEITQFTIDDLRSLKVQLAAPQAFDQAGMSYHPALANLQVKMEVRQDGRPFIVLSGQNPARDNFIDLILETQWATGRLAMNYTLLLSPPRKPVTVAKDNAPAVTADPVANKESGSIQPMPPVTVSPASPAPAREEGNTITVRPGDTAVKLALKHLPPQVTLEQMLVAMVRANPDAFIEGNVNLIRAGARIQMPDAKEATETPADEARKTVIQQTANFTAYAQRLAQAPVKAKPTVGREAAGSVAPDAPKVATESNEKDKLTLSKGQVITSGSEARLAAEREAKDAAEQLASLKKNVQSLQALSPASEPAAAASAAQPVIAAVPVPKAPAAAPVPASAPQASMWEQVTQNPAMLAGIAALLTALLGFVVWIRRKPSENAELWAAAQAPTRQPRTPPTDEAGRVAPVMPDLDLSLDTPAKVSAQTPAPTQAPTQAPTPVPTQAPTPAPVRPLETAAAMSAMQPQAAADDTDRNKLALALQLLTKGEIELARTLISSVATTGSGPLQAQARQMLGQVQ